LAFAAMLKFFENEGRFPRDRKEVPQVSLKYLAEQVGVAVDAFDDYDLNGHTAKRDRESIRAHLGFHRITAEDSKMLTECLRKSVFPVDHKPEHVHDSALAWCRTHKIEPPTKPLELPRDMNIAGQRSTGILLSLILVGLCCPTAALGQEEPRRPNFIVIMVDDMGYAGVSCFGNPYFTTPEIDRLAGEGMRLTDFHSSGTVCSPTRAGLLTGRYQQRAGIEAVIHPYSDHPEHRKGLKEVENTFAESLSEAGYAAGLVGKWHQRYPHNSVEYHPDNHGFDFFVGYHSGNIDFVSHVGYHLKHDWWHGRSEIHEKGYSTHLINKYALEFIRKNRERPFCLYVAHEAIHNPVQVPGDPIRRTEESGWKRWKPADNDERIEKFKGMTMPIDEGVGQIRKALIDLGIDRNTFVLFFSDNGPSRDFPSGSSRFRGGKGSVYEGGHRVPAIAWWPGSIEAGSTSDETSISIDVMPTLLSIAGINEPKDRPLDGVDLSQLLMKEGSLPHRSLYWASLLNSGIRSEAMRDGPWKLIVRHPNSAPGTFQNEIVELYNLADDEGERTNLAVQHPGRAAGMLNDLKAWFADTQSGATPQPGGWNEESR
jgi:arylsulfatase A-like enzyme